MTLSPANRKIAFLSVSVTLSLAISYIEGVLFSIIPLPLPGFKLGLANIITLYIIYKFDFFSGFAVSLLRILLTSLLFGNVTSFLFSLSGIILATISNAITKRYLKQNVTYIAPSAISGVAFNLGQTVTALFIVGDAIFYYAPILLAAGLFFGSVTGFLLNIVEKRINKITNTIQKG